VPYSLKNAEADRGFLCQGFVASIKNELCRCRARARLSLLETTRLFHPRLEALIGSVEFEVANPGELAGYRLMPISARNCRSAMFSASTCCSR
jgi:hypothetical protein